MLPVVGTTTPLPLPTTIAVSTTSDSVVGTTTSSTGTTFSAATDPCSIIPSLCPLGQQCISTVDSFYCVPNTQPTTSEVVVETTTPMTGTTFSALTDPCSIIPSLCPLDQQCISTVDSFYCVPNTQPTTSEVVAETTTPMTGTTFSAATDPCSIFPLLCLLGQQCISTVDSFYCVPNTQPTTSDVVVKTTTPMTGTTFSPATDPCSIYSLCPSDQQCISTVDSFYCVPYCQTTWFFYNGSCYLLVKSRKTNQEASVRLLKIQLTITLY